MSDCVALIPARAGSKRVQKKNIRRLGDHPLVAYTIVAAKESGVFSRVIVSTDDEETARIARHYGAEVPFLRDPKFAGDRSPDIGWVSEALEKLGEVGSFSILRPTSPFRQAETIRRAWKRFSSLEGIDSLRAVEPCGDHPGKMWVVSDDRMEPLLKDGPSDPPWHSRPYQDLPLVHVQNASLEIAHVRVVRESGSIAGKVIAPFLTEGHEGFDINRPSDWVVAEYLVSRGEARLPDVPVTAYEKD